MYHIYKELQLCLGNCRIVILVKNERLARM